MKTVLPVVAVSLLLALAVPARAADAPKLDAKTQDAVDQVAAKAKTVKSFSSDFVITGGPMPGDVTGSIRFRMPDLMNMKTSIASPAGKMDQTTISDGKITWIQAMGMVMKIDMEKVKKAVKDAGLPDQQGGQHNIAKTLDNLEPASLKLTGSEKVDGTECWVIEGKLRSAGPACVSVATADGLVRKLVMLTPDGKEAMTIAYKNVKLNPEFPAETFQFAPPKDAQVMDQTEMTINMIKSMVGK